MKVTRTQLSRVAEELYSVLDLNGDGRLDRHEIEQFLIANAERNRTTLTKSQFTAAYYNIDKINKGWISRDELLDFLCEQARSNGSYQEE